MLAASTRDGNRARLPARDPVARVGRGESPLATMSDDPVAFISHSSADHDAALALRRGLEQASQGCRTAPEDVAPPDAGAAVGAVR